MRDKVLTNDEMLEEAGRWRAQGRRFLVASGCFDLLHLGHVRFLQAARAQTDELLVVINSDRAVRWLKGPGRPVIDARARAEVLAALAAVSHVTVYDHIDPNPFLSRLGADAVVKGPDYRDAYCHERDIGRGACNKVVVLEIDPLGYSTTAIVERIRSADPAGATEWEEDASEELE